MTALDVHLEAEHLTFTIGGGVHVVPAGPVALARMLPGDPPAAADLTNAIGFVLDHLDDVDRELPMAAFADSIHVRGEGAHVVCAVEVGGPVELPFLLTPDALEDVFRTVATEAARDRAHNPGLPPAWVGQVVGACCALVALTRRYRPPHLVVHA